MGSRPSKAKTVRRSTRQAAVPASAGPRLSDAPAAADDLSAALALLPEVAAETPPGMPVAAALAEAEEVAAAAARHGARLLDVPFDHDLLATLPARIAALRDADSRWRIVRSRRLPRELAKLRGEATELKRDVLAAARFFLRADDEALDELAAIAEGDSLAELVRDLRALAAFLHDHGEQLPLLGYPLGPEGAAARAEELARALARDASNEHVDEAAALALAHRNRVFALVDEAVREVRAAARYALRGDPEALAAFRGGPGLGPRTLAGPPLDLPPLG